MEVNPDKEELKIIMMHYLTNGIQHRIPKKMWEAESESIKEDVFSQLNQYDNVKSLFVDFENNSINFESYGTKFLTLRWEEGMAYWCVPQDEEFSIALFSEEIRAVFWPVLNFFLNLETKNYQEESWALRG